MSANNTSLFCVLRQTYDELCDVHARIFSIAMVLIQHVYAGPIVHLIQTKALIVQQQDSK